MRDTAIVADSGLEAGVAAALTALVLMALLALRRRGARALEGTDERLLVYGRALRVLSVFADGFFALLTGTALYGYFVVGPSAGWTPNFLAFYCSVWWFLGGVLSIEVFGTSYRFSSTLFTRVSVWRGRLAVHWEDIQTVRYNPVLNWYVFRTSRGTIRMQPYMDGFEAFMRTARERIPPDRFAARAPAHGGVAPP